MLIFIFFIGFSCLSTLSLWGQTQFSYIFFWNRQVSRKAQEIPSITGYFTCISPTSRKIEAYDTLEAANNTNSGKNEGVSIVKTHVKTKTGHIFTIPLHLTKFEFRMNSSTPARLHNHKVSQDYHKKDTVTKAYIKMTTQKAIKKQREHHKHMQLTTSHKLQREHKGTYQKACKDTTIILETYN